MSNLETSLATVADRVTEHADAMQTEEAVKTSFVLPFLSALGYDVFNPAEVVPEFTADVPGKKGEKVDYAILRSGKVSILIECKGLQTPLNEKHLAQLYRYFSVTEARFAVLTNGREYWFFSDLEAPNRLDAKPFFTFDVTDHSRSALQELGKFTKADFDETRILEHAERLKYVRGIKAWIKREMSEPSDGLTRLIASDVYEGRVTAQVRETIGRGISAAFADIVRDRMRARLTSALDDPGTSGETVDPDVQDNEIETTEEELEGFLLVKAILRGTVDTSRVHIRDAKSYCAVLLDDNNRRPLVRLHFNGRRKHIGLFDGDGEARVSIETLDDMLAHADRIRATAEKYG